MDVGERCVKSAEVYCCAEETNKAVFSRSIFARRSCVTPYVRGWLRRVFYLSIFLRFYTVILCTLCLSLSLSASLSLSLSLSVSLSLYHIPGLGPLQAPFFCSGGGVLGVPVNQKSRIKF